MSPDWFVGLILIAAAVSWFVGAVASCCHEAAVERAEQAKREAAWDAVVRRGINLPGVHLRGSGPELLEER